MSKPNTETQDTVIWTLRDIEFVWYFARYHAQILRRNAIIARCAMDVITIVMSNAIRRDGLTGNWPVDSIFIISDHAQRVHSPLMHISRISLLFSSLICCPAAGPTKATLSPCVHRARNCSISCAMQRWTYRFRAWLSLATHFADWAREHRFRS